MKPLLELGVRVDPAELADLFEAPEGAIQLIYGRIRQGKSTEAVRRMLESLENGRVVYSNLRLDLSFEPMDDRLVLGTSLWSLVIPGERGRRFYRFEKTNFHWFDPITGQVDGKNVFSPKRGNGFDEIAWLNSLTDCEIYYDEGQWLLDSYEKTDVSVAKRKLITESGHVARTIIIIAQRTQSIHVNARGNVNQFFRCSKHPVFLFFTVLLVEEFQDMKGQDVDEDADPVSKTRHWSSKRAWRAFNTHYLRAGRPKSQVLHFEAYDLSYSERIVASLNALAALFAFLKKGEKSRPRDLPPSGWESRGGPSLGVESDDATLKSGERLNTVPAGGKTSIRSTLTLEEMRARRAARAAKAQTEEIPF